MGSMVPAGFGDREPSSSSSGWVSTDRHLGVRCAADGDRGAEPEGGSHAVSGLSVASQNGMK
jgi:hypothetical protein